MGVLTTGQAKALKEREADEALSREQAEAWSESQFINPIVARRPPGFREQIRSRARTLSQREMDERGIVIHEYELTPDNRHALITQQDCGC
jgi:hypothetical protein